LTFIDCLKLIVCDILLSCVCLLFLLVLRFACNPVRLSSESIKGNLLTYLLMIMAFYISPTTPRSTHRLKRNIRCSN